MGDLSMAVNLAARVWAPYRELNDTVMVAVTRRQPGVAHDLEVALRRHKPDFITLLKKPTKNAAHRELVRKSSTEGISIQGEQRKQVFSQQFVGEALILSDLFDLNELAAVELLMAGENQLPNYPGLTRGLVAVLLFYDGQCNLVGALRTLAQAREGFTWTVGVTQEIQLLIKNFIDELLQAGIVSTILDLISSMDLVKEVDRLQKDRALGPAKHRKQVTDLYLEIRQALGDVIYCLACQRPLSKQDTLRLLAHLRQDNSLNADQTLDSVTLCLLVALWYCFDVSLIQREDSQDVLSRLPVFGDQTYIQDIHQDLISGQAWQNPGLKAAAQFGWAGMLRQISQFNVASGAQNGAGDCFEEDERLIDLALEANLFSFLSISVVACSNFHSEEFYLRRLHGLVSDFIYQMPLKTKELRNRGDEMSRIILTHQAEGLEPPSQRGDLHEFMTLIGDLYRKDPLKLQLALEYWCPQEPVQGGDLSVVNRPEPKQLALFKFIRVAGDLLPAPLFLPYIHMLTGLATGPQCSHHCFNLLRVNGGQASLTSWNHIFHSMHQYYSGLRQEAYSIVDSINIPYRPVQARSMTPQEQEALCAVLALIRHIADLNETCRSLFCENQQWSVLMVLFGLLSCNVTIHMKGEILCTLAALAQTPLFAATIWQTLEASQILSTVASQRDQPGGIRVELEEVESRSEEFPLTRGFLELIGSLSQFPIPPGLGAGTRVPGFDPYLDFILNSVLLKFNTRSYKMAEEKWQVVSGCLEILVKLLSDYAVQSEDLQTDLLEVVGGGLQTVNKQPGFRIMCLLFTDSHLFKILQLVIEEAVGVFELFAPFTGQEHLERASLLCLQLLVEAFERQDALERKIRESSSAILFSGLERLLLAINPRTRKADYLVNITKFVMFNMSLPKHTLAAVKILYHVCQHTSSQSDIVNLFTADRRVCTELLQGFVECLDSNTAETKQDEASPLLSDNQDTSSTSEPASQNLTCEHIIQLMLVSLDQAAPNMAHWLLGFQLQKPVVRTVLQDPGVLDSPKSCIHSILTLLEKGLGSREGPTCLHTQPRLAELALQLIYALCVNKETSPATLRFLRTTHDFLYQQLQHLPLDSKKYGHDVSDHQAWILKTTAVELRMTSLNRQRSHTQRLIRLLLGDESQDLYSVLQSGDDGDMSVVDRESFLTVSHAQVVGFAGKHARCRLLGTLDTVSFEQKFPQPLQFLYFDKSRMETLARSLEHKSRDGVTYCDVMSLRQALLTELANQQGPMVAGQRPHILEEIDRILQTVVTYNDANESLQRKKRSFEAWRYVVQVLLTSVPHDLLSGEKRQAVLFQLLQELLFKVSGEDVSLEATASVSDILLTLMTNLRHSFLLMSASQSAGDGGSHTPWAGAKGSSMAAFSTSIQVVLRGLIDYILKSGGGIQRVRVNLYGALLYCLQIAIKSGKVDDSLTAMSKPGIEKILSTDSSEFEKLAAENMETILSYGDCLMETLSRDACDGHHVGRMLALSVLNAVVSMDHQNVWLNFLSSRGYLQHLLDSLASEDDQQLLATLQPQPDTLRALYIFQSKMSLLTRIAENPLGAKILLHGGALMKLSACTVLSLRPEVDNYSSMSDDDDEDLLPSPLSRYRLILFSVLRFCLAQLTSLGGENIEVATQVMLLIVSHIDVFNSILRSRKATLNPAYLRELSLTTAVIARANYHTELGADLLEADTVSMEFRSLRMRLQDQMLALLPHYATPESVVRHLKIRVAPPTSGTYQAEKDSMAEILQLYQEVSANLTAYARSLITSIGASSLNQNLLFGTSIEEFFLSNRGRSEESAVVVSTGRRPGLGVVLLLLDQAAQQFSLVLDSHKQHAQKLGSLAELRTEDLRQLCGDSFIEKLPSQQRQEVARSRLLHILSQKSQQLQHYAYIVENCLYITWRHLDFYLVNCIPADQATMTTPTLMRHQAGIRRLIENPDSLADIGAYGSPVISAGVSQVALGVSRRDVDQLRSAVHRVLNEAFFKKVQHVDQSYGKQRTHYSFTEAIVRRIKRVLKLHTGL